MSAPKKEPVSTKTPDKSEPKINPSLRFFLLTSLAVVFLLVANSALWVNKTVFNTGNFSEITTKSLLSESSRGAVANEIVDQALSDRPLIKNVVQEPATKFISGLLATSQAETGVKKVSSKLQIVLTSEHKENIEIDLSGVKQTAAKLIDLAGKDQESTNIDKVPNKVTLLDVSQIPEFYKLGTLFMWLGPLSLALGLLILAWPHIKAKKVKMDVILSQGLIVLAGGILGMLIGPLFRPPILARVSNINLRTVAENLYNSFIASFNSQLKVVMALGFVMIFVPLFQKLYNFLKSKKS